MNERGATVRVAACAVALSFAMLGLGSRLAFLHLGPHEDARADVSRSRSIEKKLLAGRGRIFDRGGQENILALNVAVQHVCANPALIVKNNKLRETTVELAGVLNLPADLIAFRLNRPERHYEVMKKFATEDAAREVAERNLAGIFFEPAMMRYYPQDAFLCHVLGFVNHEGAGSAGVEQNMDRYLRGSSGLLESRVDALHRELYARRARHIPALEGADVTLTIDQNLQYMVEKAIDDAVVEHSAKGAWIVVQRVRTGEILALASRPAFNLNEFAQASEHARMNRAIGFVYEPGSTMKAVVYAAAFNERLVTADERIDCENGAWLHAGRILHDFHPYGILTVEDGIKKSSNIMAAKVALRLGNQRFHDYLSAFGIGKPTGVDLPGEEGGILHPAAKWSNISCSRLAIGQGVAVTALQMLGVFCCIANDGFLMRPYLIRRVTDTDGTILLERAPEVLGRPISKETSAVMRSLLGRVTEAGGTGKRAAVEGYSVAGKTGTAQKPVNGVYSHDANVASFVGFVPADAPEIGIIVVVDEPQPLHTGGVVAGPVFGRLAAEAVRYLDIPSEEEPSNDA